MKCPITDEVHYIGKTEGGLTKPLSHMNKYHNKKVEEWVEQLKKLGYRPKIEILEEIQKYKNIDVCEKKWIQHFINDGALLLNDNLVEPILIKENLHKRLKNIDIMDISHIANFIKKRRKSLGMTQKDLSYRSGVSLKTVRKIEQFKTNFEIEGLLKILALFGCTLGVKKINT